MQARLENKDDICGFLGHWDSLNDVSTNVNKVFWDEKYLCIDDIYRGHTYTIDILYKDIKRCHNLVCISWSDRLTPGIFIPICDIVGARYSH